MAKEAEALKKEVDGMGKDHRYYPVKKHKADDAAEKLQARAGARRVRLDLLRRPRKFRVPRIGTPALDNTPTPSNSSSEPSGR